MKQSVVAHSRWYKDAIIYELHVKTFCDSNGDGIGDFRGLIEKLDYLENLGVTAIWILPFYPSPLRDDGYDIADYFSVHPHYGTLDDFRDFLAEAHRRGLRVITELVLNHTSDQNAWFQRSRRAPPGSEWRDFYVWSDTPHKYADARIIFKDFETSNWSWDPVGDAYFWHRFYAHQPDLNFDNPRVHEELFKVIDFWLDMGIDGLRLDAVPYLYEREGTNCENLPETLRFLSKLRAHIDGKYQDRMLLAEANQWPEDAAAYFGKGDRCQMNFHFPLMPRMFMALQMEDRFPILDILDQTPPIEESCQWAIFLRNHDELTLEMVTDEERDYMYRVYASDSRARINLGIRRRLAPLLANSRRKIELINTLLFSLPGTPIIYYGDEIGMGDNFYLGDRNGVRTPMQWSSDRNAGFSRANPQQLYLPITIDPEYHYEALNVETQEKSLSSLLWWTRRVVGMRKKFKAFGRGTTEFLLPDNGKVLTFVRRFEDEHILVIANLSRFAQVIELDLAAYAGWTPVEIFSQNRFPNIKQAPYAFTLGPHDYFWLLLENAAVSSTSGGTETPVPEFAASLDWPKLLDKDRRSLFETAILPQYLRRSRWFGGKARAPRGFKIAEIIRLAGEGEMAQIVFIRVDYADGSPEIYLLPLQVARGDAARALTESAPEAVLARFGHGADEAVLYDAIHDGAFRALLLDLMAGGQTLRAEQGEIAGISGDPLRALVQKGHLPTTSHVFKVEQSNSSINYGQQLFLKLYRKIEEGINPDAEITRFLSARQRFEHVPPFAGALEYRRRGGETRLLGLMQTMVPNEGDAWSYALDAVGRYFERVLAHLAECHAQPGTIDSPTAETTSRLIGGVVPERLRQLGRRTGEMHLALAEEKTEPDFAPEAFSTLYQRSLYQSLRGTARKVIQLLKKQLPSLPEKFQSAAREIVAAEKDILDRYGALLRTKIVATKTRVHGDYHLGQVLNTGKDFVIIDFEGEPLRPLSERKLKRSPLRDVAGMIRSLHYAPYTALSNAASLRPEDLPVLEPWADCWAEEAGRLFVDAYLEATRGASFIPSEPENLQVMLDAFVLDKAVYEVAYELNNRPTWAGIPLRGIQEILRARTENRE